MIIKKFIKCTVGTTAFLLLQNANADLHSRLAGQAWYDDTLDITWIANANLAASETFGAFNVEADGSMSWSNQFNPIGFIRKMNDAGYLGFNDWRPPTVRPIDGVDFNQGCSNNGSTDRCYAGAEGWVDDANNPVSELGHMYYVNLGNLGWWVPNGDDSPFSRNIQPGFGLANTGPFTNLGPESYWTNVAVNSNQAWNFVFGSGGQRVGLKNNDKFVWPVRDGDIPDPDGPVVAIGFAPVPISANEEGALTATANDENTGGAWIADIEFQLDGGVWTPMAPLDGTYDSMLETGMVTVSFADPGSHQACVRGIDQPNNIGEVQCIDIDVEAVSLPPLILVFKLIPDTPIVQGLLFEIEGLATDVNRGNSTITGAEYRIDAGSWLPMLASDGVFDTELEQIHAFIDSSFFDTGTRTVCVRASDADGQTGVEICKDVEVVSAGGTEGILVNCSHEPLWPQPGETVKISMESLRLPLDGLGTRTLVERSEIWLNDNTAPIDVKENTGHYSNSYLTGPMNGERFTYGCRARLGETAVFSGWKTVSVGVPSLSGAIPVSYTGSTSHRIDIVLIADGESYNGPDSSEFLEDAGNMYELFFEHELFNQYRYLFNFWIAQTTGEAFRESSAGDAEKSITKPHDWEENYAFADVGALMHADPFRDFAIGGMFTTERGNASVMRHEAGHSPFGLSDEYCCDTGYFEASNRPNVYETLDACEADAPDLGRVPADCRSWESTRNDETYYTSEPDSNDLMTDNRKANAADIRRIEWLLQECLKGNC